MPLTAKGRKILAAMKDKYGEEKGEQVFYASVNAGKITGVHEGGKKKKKKYAEGEGGNGDDQPSSSGTPLGEMSAEDFMDEWHRLCGHCRG